MPHSTPKRKVASAIQERNGHHRLADNPEIAAALKRVQARSTYSEDETVVTTPSSKKIIAGLVTGLVSEVKPEAIKWLWPNRIPLGKLTILQGDPGLGKTWVALDAASHVTTGIPFPDGTPCPKGEVLFVTAEDGIADTIRPRLDQTGADVEKVHYLEIVREDEGRDVALDLDTHLDHLAYWLEQHPAVRLVIFDPIAAFLGRIDAHRNNEVRGVLGKLAAVAERHSVAIIAIQHLTKAMVKSLHRSLGSIAFVAAARAVWQVSADKDDPSRRLFLPVKMNLARSYGLAFTVSDKGITWQEETVTISADDAEAEDGETPRAEAKDWLRELLRNGPIPAKDVESRAREDGICIRTLHYAKKELGVVSKKDGDGPWSWCWPETPHTPHPGEKSKIAK